MYVVFLDVDGVLISGNDIKEYRKRNSDKKNVNIYDAFPIKKLKLLSILINNTNAKIVLTSTLRLGEMFGDNYMGGAYLKLKYALQLYGLDIYDITPFNNCSKEKEIKEYLVNHDEISDYVIIDDEDMPSLSSHLLRTNYEKGIDRSIIEEASYRLEHKEEKKLKFILCSLVKQRY